MILKARGQLKLWKLLIFKSYPNISDKTGYFSLEHNTKTSGKLTLKKQGYDIDTLETIKITNGEYFEERFKGDTIYLFKTSSNFRDSIIKLNQINTRKGKLQISFFELIYSVLASSGC